jgi:hypothetical protein
MDSSVSPKDEIWFLLVCHHISNAVYHDVGVREEMERGLRVGEGVKGDVELGEVKKWENGKSREGGDTEVNVESEEFRQGAGRGDT